MALTRPKYSRIGLFDELRGLAAIVMIFYHGAYDLVSIFKINWPFFYSPFMDGVQKYICVSFILISGMSALFSRSNMKRGFILLLIAAGISAGTHLFMPSQAIYFGILHMLAVCMIVFALLEPLHAKISPAAGFFVCALLFILTYNVSRGIIGVPWMTFFRLPDSLYSLPFSGYLFPLGIVVPGFFSADFFPLFPWLFMFLMGTFIAVPIKNGNFPHFVYRTRFKKLAAIGRKTLFIYLLHQPVLIGVITAALWAVDMVKKLLER